MAGVARSMWSAGMALETESYATSIAYLHPLIATSSHREEDGLDAKITAMLGDRPGYFKPDQFGLG